MTKTWHIITCEYPPQIGGVSDHTHLLAQHLHNAGDEVHVWAPAEDTAHTFFTGDVVVHRTLGDFSHRRLDRTSEMIACVANDEAELFVQWVPHGYGYRSMNIVFCDWLRRLAADGRKITLMVHEPGLESRGSLKQRMVARVHRHMTRTLLRAASRVFIAIPAWGDYLETGTPSEAVFEWLPIPATIPVTANSRDTLKLREKFQADFLIGHLGTYGKETCSLLVPALSHVLSSVSECHVVLLGNGSIRFSQVFRRDFPQFADRVHGLGVSPERDLSRHLSICDLMLQPYIDGLSTRRTSLMNALCHGLPVVSNTGHLTERFWNDSGAVSLGPASSLAQRGIDLLRDAPGRRMIAELGLALYSSQFAWPHVISQIRSQTRLTTAAHLCDTQTRSNLPELHAHSNC